MTCKGARQEILSPGQLERLFKNNVELGIILRKLRNVMKAPHETSREKQNYVNCIAIALCETLKAMGADDGYEQGGTDKNPGA